MGNFVYDFTQKFGSTVTATQNVDTTHGPVARIEDLGRPRRTVRSTDLVTDMQIDIDLGSPVSLTAITYENTNLLGLNFLFDDNPSFTSPVDSGLVVVGTDPADLRIKQYHISAAGSLRYVRIVGDKDNVITGDAYMEIGAVGLWALPTTLSANVGIPFEKSIESRADVLELRGGGQEVGLDSPLVVRFGMTIRYRGGDAVEAQIQALAAIPRHTVGLLYENNGNTSEVYHVHRAGDFSFRRGAGAVETVSGMDFLEVA